MQRWTNDYFPSTVHRVLRTDTKNKSRYSVVYFCAPNWETEIKPLVLDGGNLTEKYKALQFGDLTPF
jgi:isopenicillin N synthase-like dioxygenase